VLWCWHPLPAEGDEGDDSSAQGDSQSGEEDDGEDSDDDGDEGADEDGDDADDAAAGAAAGGGGGRAQRRGGGSSRRRRGQGPRKARLEAEIVRLDRRTSNAKVREHELLDGPETPPNPKPMMELKAGSNVWYQAYVLKESLNEVKVRFPRECGGGRGARRAHRGGAFVWPQGVVQAEGGGAALACARDACTRCRMPVAPLTTRRLVCWCCLHAPQVWTIAPATCALSGWTSAATGSGAARTPTATGGCVRGSQQQPGVRACGTCAPAAPSKHSLVAWRVRDCLQFLGRGAWEPREEPRRSRQLARGTRASGGGAGGTRRAGTKQRRTRQRTRSGEGLT
jgi:hypothetical protein